MTDKAQNLIPAERLFRQNLRTSWPASPDCCVTGHIAFTGGSLKHLPISGTLTTLTVLVCQIPPALILGIVKRLSEHPLRIPKTPEPRATRQRQVCP